MPLVEKQNTLRQAIFHQSSQYAHYWISSRMNETSVDINLRMTTRGHLKRMGIYFRCTLLIFFPTNFARYVRKNTLRKRLYLVSSKNFIINNHHEYNSFCTKIVYHDYTLIYTFIQD